MKGIIFVGECEGRERLENESLRQFVESLKIKLSQTEGLYTLPISDTN